MADILGVAAQYQALLLVLGFVGLIVLLAGWRSFSMNKRMLAAGVVGLMLALALIPALTAPVGPGGVPPGYTAQWEILIPSTIQGTPRDTAAEIFDSNGGNGDGETPAGTLCAFGTNVEADRTNRIIRHAITIDDDVATSAATYSAPDMCSFDLSFRLLNPQDQNGDGVQDSVSIFGRVRSISATVTEDGNGSSSRRNIFLRDNTFGWYVGWSRDVDTQATDGMWISTAPPGVNDAQLGTSYDWSNLGSNAGADEDYIAFAYVFRNYGPFGYTQPELGFTYTIVIDVGTPQSFVTYTINTFLSARA